MLRLALLGSNQITLDGVPLDGFISRKAPALLYYLAVSGRPQSRTTLAGLLWGESSESKARAALRTTLYSLRKQLGAYLQSTRETIGLRPDAPCNVDVVTFQELVKAHLPANGHLLSSEQAAGLTQAIALYRGDFLAGHEEPEAVGYQEWLAGTRAYLHQTALTVLYQLLAYHQEEGELFAAIGIAGRLLALESWQEEAHRQMIRLLAESGRRSAALEQYEVCRRILWEELGVEPDAETTALYETIRDDLHQLAYRRNEHRFRLRRVASHNLPAQLTSFVGRESELNQLCRLLLDRNYRLLTLVGEGGVGKTRLALEAAEQLLSQFADGIWYVPLDLESNVEKRWGASESRLFLATAIAQAVNANIVGGERFQRRLIDFLRDRELLLVLDGFQHLLSGAELVLELLRSVRGIRILVTSRERLGFQAEYVLAVRGLDVPSSARAENALTASSVQLFAERAARSAAGFDLDADNLGLVIEICRRVGGTPLGIEMAAAWVGQRPLANIAAAISQEPDFLASPLRDLPDRQQSVRAVFEHSWSLLHQAEQICLAQLAVFEGGFEGQAALSVTGDTAADLARFVGKSLLQQAVSGRYGWHPLLQQFASEKLAGNGAADWPPDMRQRVCARHSAYYMNLVAEQERVLFGRHAQAAVLVLRREWKNLQAAWTWAVETGDLAALSQGVTGIARFMCLQGMYEQGAHMMALAAERLAARNGKLGCMLVARLLVERARFLNELARFEGAVNLASRVLEETRSCRGVAEHSTLRGEALLQAGRAWWLMGNYAEARGALKRALTIARSAGDGSLEAGCVHLLGNVACFDGDVPAGRQLFRRALAQYEQMDDLLAQGIICHNLGVAALSQGDYADAAALLEDALSLALESDHRLGEALAYHRLGNAAQIVGDYLAAERHYQRGLEIFGNVGARRAEAEVLDSLCWLYLELDALEKAAEMGRRAVSLAREVGDRVNTAWGLTHLGHVLLAAGQPAGAHDSYWQAIALFDAGGQHGPAREPRAGLAEALLAKGQQQAALALVQEIMAGGDDTSLSIARLGRADLGCIRVLQALDDPRLAHVVRRAHARLQEQAARIEDVAARHAFLSTVAASREIVSAFEALPREGAPV